MFGESGKTEESKLNSERGWWFLGFGGMYCSVVQQREEDVDDKTCGGLRGSGKKCRATPGPSLEVPVAQAGGLKNDPRKNKCKK